MSLLDMVLDNLGGLGTELGVLNSAFLAWWLTRQKKRERREEERQREREEQHDEMWFEFRRRKANEESAERWRSAKEEFP